MQRRDAIQYIKDNINIVDIVRRYVHLQRNGTRWVAPCPFHQETKPSFSVNEDDGIFYCFGCQASGDIFEFYGRINGLDFKETLEQLSLEAGITLNSYNNKFNKQEVKSQSPKEKQSARQNMFRMYTLAESHFIANINTKDGQQCREYMLSRKLSPQIIQNFGLGFAKKDWNTLANTLKRAGFNEKEAIDSGLLAYSEKSKKGYDRFRGRLIFPIRSLTNQVIAFGGRIIGNEDEAKYINSSDSLIYKKGDQLYGLAQARSSITLKGHVLLTEGYMDVLTLHQFGYSHAIGVLGTALTNEQVKRISGFTSNIVLLFDGDKAGRKAALRSAEMILVRGLKCKVVLLPEGEDIDSLLHTEGVKEFEKLQRIAPEGIDFCIQVLQKMAPKDAISFTKNFFKKIEIPELISLYISKVSVGLQLAENDLREAIVQDRQGALNRTVQTSQVSIKEQKPYNMSMREKQIMMYAVRYPHRLQDLKTLSADLALSTSLAKNLWKKIEEFGPDEVFYQLTDQEKLFWIQSRNGEAAPRDNGDKELIGLEKELEILHTSIQQSSLCVALRANVGLGDFEADLDYLRVLQETFRRIDE